MKGQFFLLGAFMLIALFFVGLQYGKPLVQSSASDLQHIYDNIEIELAHALNLGINETSPIVIFKNFTRYLEESLYFVNFSTLWIVTENLDFGTVDSSYTLNVTVGNFLDYAVTVNVTANLTSKDIVVPNNQTNSTTFEIANGTVPITFNMTIRFEDIDTEMINIILDKHNLYALVKLQRGTDFKKEELIEPFESNQSLAAKAGAGGI